MDTLKAELLGRALGKRNSFFANTRDAQLMEQAAKAIDEAEREVRAAYFRRREAERQQADYIRQRNELREELRRLKEAPQVPVARLLGRGLVPPK